jgi:hypothetical protein
VALICVGRRIGDLSDEADVDELAAFFAMYCFSFVTLTSLGYGDITPTSDAARILATLESVNGLVLLAALVGRIVGLLVAQETERLQDTIDTASPGEGLEN